MYNIKELCMRKVAEISILVFIRNVLIAVGTVGWVYLFGGSLSGIFSWLDQLNRLGHEKLDSGVYFQMQVGFFKLSTLWASIALAFWIFVATRRLWAQGNNKAKIVSRIVITIASVGWTSPLQNFVNESGRWLYWSHLPEVAKENNINYVPYLESGIESLKIAVFWFAIIGVFWAFVAANKLLPTKQK